MWLETEAFAVTSGAYLVGIVKLDVRLVDFTLQGSVQAKPYECMSTVTPQMQFFCGQRRQ